MKRIVAVIKRHPGLYRLLRYGVYARLRSANRNRIFLDIYEKNYWDEISSLSGPGSSLEFTQSLRNTLPDLVAELGVTSILDIPCGDFEWMQHVPLKVKSYIGADIVLPLIERNRARFGGRGEFLQLDLLRDPLHAVDAIFCRDCLVHLSFREIRAALVNIKATSPKYFITTTFPDHPQNEDTVTPYWRALNFELAPFNFPPPMRLLQDSAEGHKNDQGKYLGVWRGEDVAGSG